MPLYTVTTQDGFLSAEQRDVIAAELVRIHTSINHVPANFVHSIFLTYPRGHAYVAANPSPVASIVAIIRVGRPAEQKTQLVRAIWKMFQDNTGVSDSDLSIALQEISPSQAMENGVTLPEVGHESAPS
jgi:phenylpyruvate tautomerase PptA (4-oxalocrotonate tautomerase family)